MKLWVAGSEGLLGKILAKKAFLATSRRQANIADRNELSSIIKNNPGITHIVNCAAQSSVDYAETNRQETFLSNTIGPENLAWIASEIGARLIHISTDYVFSGEGKIPLKETDPTNPCNYYGETKLEGEWRVQKIFPKACILRTSWIFGEGGKNFVAKLLKLLQENETVELTDDQWGRATYAPDLADVIYRLLDHSGLYQFANQGAVNKYEFGLKMKEAALALGFPLKVKRILPVSMDRFPSAAKRPMYSVFDTTKIEQELSLSIRSWEEALREFLCNKNDPCYRC